jgi:deoxyadenosine/deoxycytidine kinase
MKREFFAFFPLLFRILICMFLFFVAEKKTKKEEQEVRYAVSVDGLPGAGKSTFIDRLKKLGKKWLKDTVFFKEDVNSWRFVDTAHGPIDLFSKFYEDPKKYGMQFQLEALMSIVRREKLCPPNKAVPVIMERSIDSCVDVFGMTLQQYDKMTDLDYDIFRRHAYMLRDLLPMRVTGVIYIEVSPEVALQRIQARSNVDYCRRAEANITLDYLQHLEWLEKKKFPTANAVPPVIRLNGELSMDDMWDQLMLERDTLIRCLRTDPDDLFGV